MTSVNDMPADIVEAATAAYLKQLEDRDDSAPFYTAGEFKDVQVGHIAQAILAERQKWTATEGMDVQRLPIGTPVEKVGGYPFPGTVVAAFHTLSRNERFVVEATGEQYAGMLHIFNGGQLRDIPKGGAA